MRVLLVEDDLMLADGLRDVFRRMGHSLDHLTQAEPVPGALRLTSYDLLVVDIGLPGMSGLELVQRLRDDGHAMPVLMLTARDALEDKVRGLNGGADDYLVKPFAIPELSARAEALMRRSRSHARSALRLGQLEMDVGCHEARVAGQVLPLTGREWALLHQLLLAAPKVLGKEKLTDSLSAWDKEITPNAIEIYVSRLRGKLEGSGVTVRTVRGIGYRLES